MYNVYLGKGKGRRELGDLRGDHNIERDFEKKVMKIYIFKFDSEQKGNMKTYILSLAILCYVHLFV